MPRKKDPRNAVIGQLVQRGFGERVKRVRAARGTKQLALAVDLRITRTSISNIERGRHRVFLDQAYVAAQSLGVDIAELLPPLSEIFPSKSISFVSDDPVSSASARTASIVADVLREELAESRSRPKRARKEKR